MFTITADEIYTNTLANITEANPDASPAELAAATLGAINGNWNLIAGGTNAYTANHVARIAQEKLNLHCATKEQYDRMAAIAIDIATTN